MLAAIDDLIARVGGKPDDESGRLIREMIQSALRLAPDQADLGELKLVSRSFSELRYALKVFRPYQDRHKISIFGSARTPPDHPDYAATVRFSQRCVQAGWMVITGAGGGIMRAGHEGAGKQESFGVSIRLPFEAGANDIITGDPKHISFRYFFTRKLILVSQADALALFPGGFGTLDEGFEVLTLVQTGKSPMIPVVLVEPPGSRYWEGFDAYVRGHLLERGLISPEDLNLYRIFHDADLAAAHVTAFYDNYHSSRFVRDQLVIRLNRPASAELIGALNDEFRDIIVEGAVRATGPLEGESDHPALARLAFRFNRRSYGRLRAMIDRINDLGGRPGM
jgi:hypothetical protein